MDDSVTTYDEGETEEFLNTFENIALFWRDGALNENHVREMFGANIRTIREDLFIKGILNKWVEKDRERYFNNLRELIKRSKRW